MEHTNLLALAALAVRSHQVPLSAELSSLRLTLGMTFKSLLLTTLPSQKTPLATSTLSLALPPVPQPNLPIEPAKSVPLELLIAINVSFPSQLSTR